MKKKDKEGVGWEVLRFDRGDGLKKIVGTCYV